MASGNRRFRPLFPAALLLFGAGLSCWCACFNGPSAAEISEIPRRQLQQELAQALPPSGATSPSDSERLQVTGNWPHFQVIAIGNFSADGAGTFVDRASRAYLAGRKPNLTITIYNDAGGARALVGTFTIGPAADLEDALLANLPPPLREIPADQIQLRVTAFAQGTADHFVITISGPFTPERAQTMAERVREVYRTKPGGTRFTVRIFNLLEGGLVPIESFDTEKDK